MLEEDKTVRSEEKAKRIAVAATVAGVMLIVFLVIILTIQFVQIGVRNRRLRELDRQKALYEQMIDENGADLEFYQTERGLYYLALQQRWTS